MEDYKVKSLSIISDANILKPEEFQIIEELRDELEDTFKYAQVFRTRTEMEASVLDDLHFPTPDAKYWQAVREQNVMFQEIVSLSYEYRKNLVEIKILERDLLGESDDLERELLQIEIDRKNFIRLNQERTAQDRIREIKEWHEIKQRLIPDMEFSLKDVNEHQLISYTRRWIQQAYNTFKSGADASTSEINNLLGQLDKGMKLCNEKGVLDKVMLDAPDDVKRMLMGVNSEWLLPNTSPLLIAEKAS